MKIDKKNDIYENRYRKNVKMIYMRIPLLISYFDLFLTWLNILKIDKLDFSATCVGRVFLHV